MHENEIQANLGSALKGSPKYIGRETIDDKSCDVYEDSTGYKEWIWTKYKLPIQSRSETNHDVNQISIVKKEIIEINQPISNNTYEPPQ